MTKGKDGRTCGQSRMHLIEVTSTMHEAPELASPADALRVALMMLARRERLEIGGALKVMVRTGRRRRRREADLNGVWQAVNTANWDLQEHVVA